ncbi:MAG: TonB-dependent receptor [Methylococcales bacterium]|nr:TonB-dependent receptor [Methylococcales bacterium]
MYKQTVSLLLLVAVNCPLYADNQLEDDVSMEELIGKSFEEIGQYVTTASKMKEKVSKSVATTTVIEQKQIKEMGARNLLDILKTVPGFGVTQSILGTRQIEVRGIRTNNSEKILFLLNGHPLDHQLLGATSNLTYEDLPVGTIKRIEIVRGSSSALYGANAFMAVVNIITQNAKDLDGFHASAGIGSFDTQQYQVSWGKLFDNGFEAALHFNYADTNGIDSPLYTDNSRTLLGTSKLTEERIDFEWQLAYEDFKFDGRYINKKQGTFFGITNILSDDKAEQDFSNYFLKLSREWKINNSFTLDTQLFYDSFDYDVTWNIAPDTYLFPRFSDTRLGGELVATYVFNNTQTLIVGASYAEESHENLKDKIGRTYSSSIDVPHTSAEYKRSRWGVYMQDVWDPIKDFRLTVGLRYDEYSDFGGTLNPRVGFNWEFSEGYSLRFSYGTAYRPPSVGELTLKNNPVILGNSALTPELVETLEGGVIIQPIKGLTLQATYYYTDINKIITPTGTLTLQTYNNTGHIITQGVETEIRYNFMDDFFNGSYLSANGVWQNSIQLDRQLADVPRYRVNLMANWAIDKTWSSFAHVLIKSSTPRNLGDTRDDLAGYAVVNLGILGKNLFNKQFDIGFNIHNLLNKKYYDPAPQNLDFVGDFQAEGISFLGHIDVHF